MGFQMVGKANLAHQNPQLKYSREMLQLIAPSIRDHVGLINAKKSKVAREEIS